MSFYRDWLEYMHGPVQRQDSIFKIAFAALIVSIIMLIAGIVGMVVVKSKLFIVILVVAIVFIAALHALVWFAINHYYDN